tara:strand:+ start:41102 stop:41710 length:609 start_codon:yes stop_codon:yes gene_type:complete
MENEPINSDSRVENNLQDPVITEKKSFSLIKLLVIMIILGLLSGLGWFLAQKTKVIDDSILSPDLSIEIMDETPELTPEEEAEMVAAATMYLDREVLTVLELPGFGYYLARASDGRTLYVQRTKEECEGECADRMSPFTSEYPHERKVDNDPVANRFGSMAIEDGLHQYTWDDKPIYLYALDRRPNDVLGDGFQTNFTLLIP